MNEHTLTQLRHLRLDGMVRAIEEQATSTAVSALSFDERLSLLVQREVAWRDDRRVERLLKAAKLKVSTACVQDIDWRASRSLDRSLMAALAGGGLDTQCPKPADHWRHRLWQNLAGLCSGTSGRQIRLLGAVCARGPAL
jgi:hypothetical protein